MRRGHGGDAQNTKPGNVKRKVVEMVAPDFTGNAWRAREFKSWCSLKAQGVGGEVFEMVMWLRD